eukprot:15682041-Heterocapsa_arctica.AAC.1
MDKWCTQQCKFFLRNTCNKGTECAFLHEGPLGRSSPSHWNPEKWEDEQEHVCRKQHQLREVSSGLTMMVPLGEGNFLIPKKLKAGMNTSLHGTDMKTLLRVVPRIHTSPPGHV